MNTIKIVGAQALKELFDQVKESADEGEIVAWNNKELTSFAIYRGGKRVKIYVLIQ